MMALFCCCCRFKLISYSLIRSTTCFKQKLFKLHVKYNNITHRFGSISLSFFEFLLNGGTAQLIVLLIYLIFLKAKSNQKAFY